MNFLNKARKKVEAAVNEVVNEARNTQAGQSGYNQGTPGYGQQQSFPSQQQWQQQQHYAPQATYQQTSHPPPPPLPARAEQPTYYTPPPAQPTYSQTSPHPTQTTQIPVRAEQTTFYPSPPAPPPINSPSHQLPQSPPTPAPSSSTPNPTSPPDAFPCLGNEGALTKYTQFFALKVSPSFSICKNCYQSKVTPHPSLIYDFTPHHPTNDSEQFVCDFSYPSALAILTNECIPHSTTAPLLDFANRCSELKPCNGSVIAEAGPCYETVNDSIPGLAICPTCYFLYLSHTSFAPYFHLIPDATRGKTQQWTCDLAVPFFVRLLRSLLSKPAGSVNFERDFKDEAKTRLAIPPCPGVGKAIVQFAEGEERRGVVLTSKGRKDGIFCFACFCDYLANTIFEDSFMPALLGEDQMSDAGVREGRGVPCDLASVYSKMAMEDAIKKNDEERWRVVARLIGKVGECMGKKGVDEGDMHTEREKQGEFAEWYCLTAYPAIEICPHCYWLKVNIFGASHLFEKVRRELVEGRVRMCFLAPSTTPVNTSTDTPDNFEDSLYRRSHLLYKSLLPGYEAGDWSPLLTVAKTISTQPPPCGGKLRGFKQASGRKWYGRIRPNNLDENDCTIIFCEECHSRAVKGTPYSSLFSTDFTSAVYSPTNSSLTAFCNTYTSRTLTHLHSAASTGDLASFAQWWNRREMLRQKKDSWQPIIEQQLLRQGMANFKQSQDIMLRVHAQGNALSRIGAAGMVEAVMGDPGVRYGNSQIGYDSYTRGRAEAEQAWVDAKNMPVRSGAMGMIGETQRIFIMATRDEEAFNAVE